MDVRKLSAVTIMIKYTPIKCIYFSFDIVIFFKCCLYLFLFIVTAVSVIFFLPFYRFIVPSIAPVFF